MISPPMTTSSDTDGLVERLRARADTLERLGRENRPLTLEHEVAVCVLTREPLREAADTIEAQAARIAVLEGALRDVLPFIRADYIECHGFKCRHPTCGSCQGEDATTEAEAKGLAAEHRARQALSGADQ